MPEAEPLEWSDGSFHDARERVAAQGVIEAQNVRLSSHQLRQLLDAAPEDPKQSGRRRLYHANFRGATFEGPDVPYFGGPIFEYADFAGASFTEWPEFRGATFAGLPSFEHVTFNKGAGFRGIALSLFVSPTERSKA